MERCLSFRALVSWPARLQSQLSSIPRAFGTNSLTQTTFDSFSLMMLVKFLQAIQLVESTLVIRSSLLIQPVAGFLMKHAVTEAKKANDQVLN